MATPTVPATDRYSRVRGRRIRSPGDGGAVPGPGRGRPQPGLPPIEGPDRQRFIEQAQTDFMDYAMLGDAEATIEDGVLVFRIDLRPAGPTSGPHRPGRRPSALSPRSSSGCRAIVRTASSSSPGAASRSVSPAVDHLADHQDVAGRDAVPAGSSHSCTTARRRPARPPRRPARAARRPPRPPARPGGRGPPVHRRPPRRGPA